MTRMLGLDIPAKTGEADAAGPRSQRRVELTMLAEAWFSIYSVDGVGTMAAVLRTPACSLCRYAALVDNGILLKLVRQRACPYICWQWFSR